MSISKILLFALIALASTKNVVLLGDSRTVGIGVQVLKFDLTTKATPEGGKRSIISSTAKIYNGHSIKVVAQSGSHFATFVNNANAVSTGAIKVLGSSSSGTIVFLWLGVNRLDADATAGYYKSLANKFKKLKFYAISVTGVSSQSNRSNDKIKSFNTKMRSLLKNSGLPNLKYKSILLNDDPTKVAIKDKVVLNIDTSTTDAKGLHYKTEGSKAILNAMLSGI
jgi:hypothetical protein